MFRLRLRQQTGNPAEFRLHGGLGDHCHGMARRHHRAGVNHRGSIAQPGRRGYLGIGLLADRLRLTSQGRLGHPQARRPQQPGVGRHVVARLEFDPVARHQLIGRQRPGRAAAGHPGLGGRQLLQRRQRPPRPLFLQEADQTVDQHDRHDRRGVGPLANHSRDHRGRQQNQNHQLLKLPQQLSPPGGRRRLPQLVGPQLGQTLGGQGLGQPGSLVAFQPLQHVSRSQCVPGNAGVVRLSSGAAGLVVGRHRGSWRLKATQISYGR